MEMKCTHILLMLALACLSPLKGASQMLFSNGQTDYTIVLRGDASVTERTAAKELQQTIKQMSGTTMPISQQAAPTSKHIYIGWRKECGKQQPAAEDEAYTYNIINGDLYIFGGSERGTMYGVYAFLEDELGVHWLTSDCTIIPNRKQYRLGQLSRHEKPAIVRRLDFCHEALRKNDWAARNRLNSQYQLYNGEHGTLASYWGIHTFETLIPPERYFEAHPEYFSIRMGKRSDKAQLCLSNKQMRLELTKNLKAAIKANPGHWCYDVSQNDNKWPCECRECAKLVKKYGGHSGAMLWFVNKVAREVRKEFPDVLIGTFAYQYTRHAPTSNIKAEDNVVVRLCNIECCMAHPLDKCPENKDFLNDMDAWHRHAKHIYIWDYTTGFTHYLLPFPNFRVLARNYQYFIHNNVMGVMEEGAHNAPWAEFSEMKQWLIAKLMWNPYQDVDSLADIFIRGYYGKAAPQVRRYYDLCLQQINDDVHFTINLDWKSSLYDDRFVTDGIDLLQKAETASRNDTTTRQRVRRLQAQLYYLKLRRSTAKAIADGTAESLADIIHNDSTILSERELSVDKLLKDLGFY